MATQILLKRGTKQNVLTTLSSTGVQGEPHYTTDTKQLFIHDGTRVQPVQTLDMAIFFEDEIISFNNEVVYLF